MVSKTIELKLTPSELATLFAEMDCEQQAWFFACVWRIAKDWPGAGWCQQSYEIIRSGSVDTLSAIETLASHLDSTKLAEPASEQEQLIRIIEDNQLLSRDQADALIEYYRRLREDQG